MKLIDYFVSKLMSRFALKVAVMNVNSVCWFYAHQPELPEELKCLNKLPD